MPPVLIWIVSFLSIIAVLSRPFQIPEWVFASFGAAVLIIFKLIPVPHALEAIGRGTDVYCFLIGMMLLSEQARADGLFDWAAEQAAMHAKGSSQKLFFLIYSVGVLVTVFMSNDATAVVMTPAVYAAVTKAGAKPLPYLFACALIANAASFFLPISNPANLVVFASHMPKIFSWLATFALPSIAAIIITYLVLLLWFRKDLSASLSKISSEASVKLTLSGKLTAMGLLGVVFVMLLSSTLGWDLGLPTLIASCTIATLAAAQKKAWPKEVLKEISWGIIPLVAGLFVIVEAMNSVGAKTFTHDGLANTQALSPLLGKLAASFGVGITANLMNNLPVGLVSGMAVHAKDISESTRNAVLIGVDLGPNLSVTGSLATLLWLMVLRREGEKTSGFAFFKLGVVAMPLALAAAIFCL